jgi:hypothetical protein
LCAEAEGLFISMDFGRFAAMKEQRGGRSAIASRAPTPELRSI